MRSVTRAGFTLLELLIGVAMTTLLAALLTTLAVAASRGARNHLLLLDAERARVAAGAWWRNDLRAVERGDLTVPAPDQLVLRRPIGGASVCGRDAGAIVVAQSDWRGDRTPVPSRDDAWLLRETTADFWSEGSVTAVASALCPDGRVGWRLAVAQGGTGAVWVRIVEPVRARFYASGGATWLGLEPLDGSSVVQPFAGPLASGSAFRVVGVDIQASLLPTGVTPGLLIAPWAAP